MPPKSSHVYCHANPPGDVIERLAIARGVEEQRPWEKQRPCEGRGLFFLIGLTRAKGNAVQLLDLAQVMLKDDVGQLVGDIADAACLCSERVVHDHRGTVDIEGACRERECLEPFDFLQAGKTKW